LGVKLSLNVLIICTIAKEISNNGRLVIYHQSIEHILIVNFNIYVHKLH